MRNFSLLLLSLFFLASCQKDVRSDEGLLAKTVLDLSYGADASQKLDLYLPAGRSADSTRLLIMVHGGAWSEGDKTDFTPYVPDMQQRFPGWAIANINYRLANTTTNHFPTQENDM